MKKQNWLDTHIMQEALSCFTLQGSMETQINIAEQIASNSYENLESLTSTIRGYAKNERVFKKELAEAKANNFFTKYW